MKRSDIRDVLPPQEGVILPDDDQALHMSLGYVERLFRKLANEYPDASVASLEITKYSEACGLFAGTVLWKTGGDSRQIQFQWQGSGDVESSWNHFSLWAVQ